MLLSFEKEEKEQQQKINEIIVVEKDQEEEKEQQQQPLKTTNNNNNNNNNNNDKEVSYYDSDFQWEDFAKTASIEAENFVTVTDDIRENILQQPCSEMWDSFYGKHDSGKVYKPRRYLIKEFPELISSSSFSATTTIEEDDNNNNNNNNIITEGEKETTTDGEVDVIKYDCLLEVGCGYGASIEPILEHNSNQTVYVCDFSTEAINILNENSRFDPYRERLHTFVYDAVNDCLEDFVPLNTINIGMMIFALSAIAPEHHYQVIDKLFRILQPGGIICFRDYGLYDLTMMRNAKNLGNQLFYREDGTLAYFFTLKKLAEIFENAGFITLENRYATILLKNRKNKKEMKRVFIHGKFRKPFS